MPDPDPYSTAMSSISKALKEAFANNGAMSNQEYGILTEIAVQVMDLDPDFRVELDPPSECTT